MSAAHSASDLHDAEAALARAATEPRRTQLGRWIRFAGYLPGEPLELQALHVSFSNSDRTYYAHARDIGSAVALLAKAERDFSCPGFYLVGNLVDPSVATRAKPDEWHAMAFKGVGTSDNDITHRVHVFIDVDAKRPTGTSATEEQVTRTAAVACRIHDRLSTILGGSDALGYGHSGNGRSIFLALGRLDLAESAPLVKGIVAALHALESVPGSVEIDTSVTDAKRLVPAWGTLKRKGVPGIVDRPHRRTAFTCARSVRRLGLAELETVVDTLRDDLDEDGRAAVDKAMGVRPAARNTSAPRSESPSPAGDDPWKRANDLASVAVAEWLGVTVNGVTTCPGCGETAGVDVIRRGLKCLHARCASKGRQGFRTNIDLTMEVRNLGKVEALQALAERFGFETRGNRPPERRDDAQKTAQSERVGRSAFDVLLGWIEDGPLVHVSTGFPTLDKLTEGGPVYGTRWYLIGAPDAGKTAILLQWIADWASQGIVVGVLAVDEEPGDLVTRLAQRLGYSRHDCEQRGEDTMERLIEELGPFDRYIRFYDDRWTIESAAADLAQYAATVGDNPRLAFVLDSIQSVSCDSVREATKELGPREHVAANVRAVRAVGTQYHAICVATSEMNRNAYRSIEAAEASNDMAAGAESRAIEFSARVMVALRSVATEPDLIEVRVAKNKHGRSYPAHDAARFHWRLDRARQSLAETDAPAGPPKKTGREKTLAELEANAVLILQVIVDKPGLGNTSLEVAVRTAGHRIGRLPFAAALEYLRDTGKVEDRVTNRGKRVDHHYFPSVRSDEEKA